MAEDEDNVIRPAFGSRRLSVAKKSGKVSELFPKKLSALEQDIIYCLSNLELVLRTHELSDDMSNYLFDFLGLSRSSNSLRLRRSIVSGYTFQHFCNNLLDSSPAQWRADQAHFGALFMEFHERQKLILSALKERPKQVRTLAGDKLRILFSITEKEKS